MSSIALRRAAAAALVGCALAEGAKPATPSAAPRNPRREGRPKLRAPLPTAGSRPGSTRLRRSATRRSSSSSSTATFRILRPPISTPSLKRWRRATMPWTMPEPVRARLGEPLRYADIVAAGILRPGYTDDAGDRSDGDMGYAVTDNFTPVGRRRRRRSSLRTCRPNTVRVAGDPRRPFGWRSDLRERARPVIPSLQTAHCSSPAVAIRTPSTRAGRLTGPRSVLESAEPEPPPSRSWPRAFRTTPACAWSSATRTSCNP